jgi:hypothetical protein
MLRVVDNFFLRATRRCNSTGIVLRIIAMNKQDTKALILKAGGPRALAKRIGTSRQAVAKWERVPAHWVMLLVELTGVPAEKIRPDVFARRPLKCRAGNGHRAAA